MCDKQKINSKMTKVSPSLLAVDWPLQSLAQWIKNNYPTTCSICIKIQYVESEHKEKDITCQ
jgi:hypothetical protein